MLKFMTEEEYMKTMGALMDSASEKGDIVALQLLTNLLKGHEETKAELDEYMTELKNLGAL